MKLSAIILIIIGMLGCAPDEQPEIQLNSGSNTCIVCEDGACKAVACKEETEEEN